MQTLSDRVKENFDFMFKDYGFVFSDKPDDKTDWVVVLICDFLRIRFVEDRANIFADISFTSDPDVWYEISSVLSLMNKTRGIADEVRTKNSFSSLRSVLKRNLGELIISLNKEGFRSAVTRMKSI
jgi:hypothetical protein